MPIDIVLRSNYSYFPFHLTSMTDVHENQLAELSNRISTNSSVKAAMIITNLNFIKLRSEPNGVANVKVLNELVMEVPRGLMFPRFHVLYEPFSRKLDQLFQAGIVQRLVQSYYNFNMAQITKGPKVLTIEHLALGFQVWLFFLMISTIAFIAEILFSLRGQAKEILLSIHVHWIFSSVWISRRYY